MHLAFLSILIALSFVDLFFHGGTSFAPMALLYVGLKLQADSAAGRLAKLGLIFPRPKAEKPQESWIPPAEKDPFREIPRLRLVKDPEPEKAKVKAEPKRTRRPRPEPQPQARSSLYRAPNFNGPAHEILGIKETANTGVIVGAFRHWIKVYHPDHLGPQGQGQNASDRARKITTAKHSLLDRRRQMRRAA